MSCILLNFIIIIGKKESWKMGELINWIVEMVGDLGYMGIFIMMFLESSLFPFPSEVVMIPAGYLASKGEMSLFLVILFGILGLTNWVLSLTYSFRL